MFSRFRYGYSNGSDGITRIVTVVSSGTVDSNLLAQAKVGDVARAIADFQSYSAMRRAEFAQCLLSVMAQPQEVGINKTLFRPPMGKNSETERRSWPRKT